MDFKELDVKSIHDAAVEDCNDSVKKNGYVSRLFKRSAIRNIFSSKHNAR